MKPSLSKPSALDSVNGASAVSPGVESCLKKRWLYLLPAVFVTYSLAYLDRANFGFGSAGGMAATLHITGNQASLLTGMFFLGYFFFQMPSAAFAHRRSASWLVFSALVAWGMLAALTGVLTQFWMLALDRFLLGVAESCIFPAMLLLLTRWFTRAERSRANTFLILGNPVTVIWMSAITGFLIQDFGWQKTFMLEGIPSVLWAVVWILFVRDRPAKASWITPEAAAVLEQRLSQEQLSVPVAGAVRSALLRPDVIMLSVQYFFWSIGVYGIVLWLPTIVRQGSSLSMANTGLLSACPYIFAVGLMLLVSYVSDKTLRREALVWPLLLLSGIALFGSFLSAQRSFAAAFVCLIVAGGCMYAPYGPFFAIVPERVPREVTAEVIALINSCGALGGFVGSYLVGLLRTQTGNDRAGFLFMSFSLVCSSVIILLLGKAKASAATLVPEAR